MSTVSDAAEHSVSEGTCAQGFGSSGVLDDLPGKRSSRHRKEVTEAVGMSDGTGEDLQEVSFHSLCRGESGTAKYPGKGRCSRWGFSSLRQT